MLELKPSRGFTLLELMVTIAIVAIVATIAVPSFQNMIAKQRQRSAVNDLIAELNFARSEAIKRNKEVTVTPDSTWADGWSITYEDTSVSPAVTRELRSHPAITGVTMTSNGEDDQISYLGDGRRGDEESITITPDPSGSVSPVCVSVSSTGKPSLDAGSCP